MTRFRFRALIVGCATAMAFIIPGCFDWGHEPPCEVSSVGVIDGGDGNIC